MIKFAFASFLVLAAIKYASSTQECEPRLVFNWIVPDVQQAVEFTNPIAKWTKSFEKIKDDWDGFKPDLNKAVDEIKTAAVTIQDLVPDGDLNIRSDFKAFKQKLTTTSNKVQYIHEEFGPLKDLLITGMNDVDDLLSSIKKDNSNFIKINDVSLTGKKLLLEIKKEDDECGPDKIIMYYPSMQPFSSTHSFESNPTHLGSNGPVTGITFKLPYTQELILNGNLGTQYYNVLHDYGGKEYYTEQEVTGMTEEDLFLELQKHYRTMELSFYEIEWKMVKPLIQSISSVKRDLALIADRSGVVDEITATLEHICTTLELAKDLLFSKAKASMVKVVKKFGKLIEKLPEKSPVGLAETMSSVNNAYIFPQYIG